MKNVFPIKKFSLTRNRREFKSDEMMMIYEDHICDNLTKKNLIPFEGSEIKIYDDD